MGTVKDPRESERDDNEKLKDDAEHDQTKSAQPQPEEPKYQITDWASF